MGTMTGVLPDGLQENWEPGAQPYFEYQCYEGHDSADAQLWYRSHQQVTVLRRNVEDEVANGVDGTSFGHRFYECGCPATYQVRFGDGLEGTATEDELLTDSKFYNRPDPPAPPADIPKGVI